MPLLCWEPEYSINEEVLDNHHRELFDLLNTVYENVMNSLEVDCVLPIIDRLSEYTGYHFAVEEQYMREKGFPYRELEEMGYILVVVALEKNTIILPSMMTSLLWRPAYRSLNQEGLHSIMRYTKMGT